MSTTAPQMVSAPRWCVVAEAEHGRFANIEGLVQSIGSDAREMVESAAGRAAAAADRMALIEGLRTHGPESQNRALLFLHPDGSVRLLVAMVDIATDSQAKAERLAQDLHDQALAANPESDDFFGVASLSLGSEASQ